MGPSAKGRDPVHFVKPVVMSEEEIEESILAKGQADFISMCRPFIREPALVRRIREGKTEMASCESCNQCFAAIANDRPVRCSNSEISAKRGPAGCWYGSLLVIGMLAEACPANLTPLRECLLLG